MDIKINILNENVKIAPELIAAAGGDELIARLFYNRGFTSPDAVRQMLDERLYIPTKPEEFPGMDRSVERILRAVSSGEKIAVYGDYDVDGVTSTAALMQCLGLFTDRLMYHVPDRFTEGYGMNSEVIKNIAVQGAGLIITCDCGVSNHSEIKLAKELGMDVIVTDHHNLPDELPEADVVLNPKLLPEGHKARDISGCGMAYFLCCSLLEKTGRDSEKRRLLDLLAMSLVADVVSLDGENRYLLRKAMPVLFNTERTGLRELFQVVEKDCRLNSEEDIAFQLAPRINAAGRMDSARLPVELLLTEDPAKAKEMSLRIDFLNRERKKIQQEILEEAVAQVEQKKKNRMILVLFGEHWHHGIIGITAGKISETYRKPVILLSMKEDGVTAVGSARSVDDINIYELIKGCSGKLLKFGGHSMAAGLSLKREDVEGFSQDIEMLAEKKYFIKEHKTVDVDLELEFDGANEELYRRLLAAGPYGEGFGPPSFLSRGVTVLSDRKTDRNHHIMVLSGKQDERIQAVQWFGEDTGYNGKTFDIVYRLGWNTYRGASTLQVGIEHLVAAGLSSKKAFIGKIEDMRGVPAEQVLLSHPGCDAYYEGLDSKRPVEMSIDRYGIPVSDIIVFFTTPVNSEIFRELVSIGNPKLIILNFSVLPDYSFKGFLSNLLGIIKYAMNNESGYAYISEMAVKLCVEDNLVRAALKYLRAAGKISYGISEEDGSVSLAACNNAASREIHIAESHLRDALVEKHAYMQFILGLEAERFKEYLK